MYLHNKYRLWYYNIIQQAQSRTIHPEVVEKHHIFPKSLGGTNEQDNLVKLSPREHYICHLLLTKMCEGRAKQKMIYALWAIMNLSNPYQERKFIKGRLYESLRLAYIQSQKDKAGLDHPSRGKKTGRTKDSFTAEWKENISAAKKGKPGHSKGIPRPDHVKEAVSKANKGRIPWNKGIKNFKNLSKT